MISRFGFCRLELTEALSKCAYNNIMAIYLLLGRYKNEVLIKFTLLLLLFNICIVVGIILIVKENLLLILHSIA